MRHYSLSSYPNFPLSFSRVCAAAERKLVAIFRVVSSTKVQGEKAEEDEQSLNACRIRRRELGKRGIHFYKDIKVWCLWGTLGQEQLLMVCRCQIVRMYPKLSSILAIWNWIWQKHISIQSWDLLETFFNLSNSLVWKTLLSMSRIFHALKMLRESIHGFSLRLNHKQKPLKIKL